MEREEAIELIRGSALAGHADKLENDLGPSARLIVRDENENLSNRLDLSHLGGVPALPEGIDWPVWDKREYLKSELAMVEKRLEFFAAKPAEQPERIPGLRERRLKGIASHIESLREQIRVGQVPLAFLGQLSLREICRVAPIPGFPGEGNLAFFYDSSWLWGFTPLHKGHCRVLYFPEDLPSAPVPYPEHLATQARFPQRALAARCEWTLPTYLKLDNGDLNLFKNPEYRELLKKLNSDDPDQREPVHRCGGNPQEIQSDMRLECQLVTNGINCGGPAGYRDPRRAELEKGAPDWQLLVQFDSDETNLGWMWGDAGRVYFWARKRDIQVADFSNVWAILQCY
jgi:uncharacterized protein YwqG